MDGPGSLPPWRPLSWLETAVYPVAEELDIGIRPRALTAIAWGHLFAGELLVHTFGVAGVRHIGDVVQRYARRPHVLDIHIGEQGADVPGKADGFGHVLNSGYAAVKACAWLIRVPALTAARAARGHGCHASWQPVA